MNQPHDYHRAGYYSQLGRYEQHQQGFSDEEKQPQIVISQYDPTYESTNILDKKKTRARHHEPKIKLKYINNGQINRTNISNIIADKEFHNRNQVSKSLEFKKKELNRTLTHLMPILKSKRTLIGENFSVPPYALQDFKAIKQSILADGAVIAFEAAREINTHGLIKKIALHSNRSSFLNSKYNSLLKQRIKDSFITPKKRPQSENPNKKRETLTFNNQIQSGNLQLVAQVSQNQYDLYLRIDTNTHGHQNWFNFELQVGGHNENNSNGCYRFNMCNIKRQFKLIQKGQRIFVKQCNRVDQKWQPSGTDITVAQNSNPKITHGRIYKLSFTLHLKQNTKYAVAMLPAYTYSQMLDFVEGLEAESRKYVEVELLGYSLTGLALPLVTITNRQAKAEGKKVVLVSSRVHPGQTVASLVVEGLMRSLVEENSKSMVQLLKMTVFKIVPMMNPDGVVFGNFRTNYLGVDLNRAFHTDDQVLNPEIWALKNLGRELKSQYGNNFYIFLDLHGHSSQKNIFTYGPNFEYNDPNFYIARILPKILSMRSKYFKYPSCSFKLEEHKLHTARAFFLTELNVMTYTIESTYSLYDDLDGGTKLMRVEDWLRFGGELADGLEVAIRMKEMGNIRSNRDLRNILTANQNEEMQMIKKIKSQVKKQAKNRIKLDQKASSQDSDGQSQQQDLTEQQRKQTQKKVLQYSLPFSLPKVLKPAILYPTVTPKLFEVNQQKDESNFKILYTKRTKYNTLRMMNANSMYASYLKNLDQLDKFKPSARNIRLEKKLEI